jgi:hypothetical protein
MSAGPDIVATDATPPRCTSRIVLRYGRAARVGTNAARVRARRTRAGRDVGISPALRAVRRTGRVADARERSSEARRAYGRLP